MGKGWFGVAALKAPLPRNKLDLRLRLRIYERVIYGAEGGRGERVVEGKKESGKGKRRLERTKEWKGN